MLSQFCYVKFFNDMIDSKSELFPGIKKIEDIKGKVHIL